MVTVGIKLSAIKLIVRFFFMLEIFSFVKFMLLHIDSVHAFVVLLFLVNFVKILNKDYFYIIY